MRVGLVCLLVAVVVDCTADADALTGPAFTPRSFATIPVLPPPTTWTATCGTVTPTGLWTAPAAAGVCRITVSQSGTLPATATATVAAPPPSTGTLAAGMWNYPTTYCNTLGMTGVAQSIAPETVLGNLQTARRCGVRLVVIPLRKYVTTTGDKGGPFSLDSATAFDTRLAAVLRPDTLAKYQGHLIGLNLADDYGCASCWGGTVVTNAQIAAWATDLRQKIPGLALGVLVEPSWPTTTTAALLDYAWAQYHTGKGDATVYFDKQFATAASKGLALAAGVNVEDCGGNDTPACTPDQVRAFLGLAASYPANCFLAGWTYNSTTLAQPGMTDAWRAVFTQAAGHPDVPCRRR